jgi:membrane-associated phospholipid phosphatase
MHRKHYETSKARYTVSYLVGVWLLLGGTSCVHRSAMAPQEPVELRHDLRVDIPVTAGAIAWVVGSEAAKSIFAPTQCRWCDRAADGTDTLNPLDAATRAGLRWNNTGAAATASDVGIYAVVPLFGLGMLALSGAHDNALRQWPVDALLLTQAVALASSLNQLVKFIFGRERPFVHVLSDNDKLSTKNPDDNNLSFSSGHTNLAFSLAVAAGTIATLRGYRWAPAIWVGGLVLATLTGYLRIAADKHYLTDVVGGAVLGSAVGFLVPWLFHQPTAAPATP